jgi:hypothetical protein
MVPLYREFLTAKNGRGERVAADHKPDLDGVRYLSAFPLPAEAFELVDPNTGRIKGYNGPVGADRVHWDIDREGNIEAARADMARLVASIRKHGVNPRVYYSGGKGYHVELPAALFGGFDVHVDTPKIVKAVALELAGDVQLDTSVYSRTRLWRVAGSRHEKGGAKHRIDPDMLEVIADEPDEAAEPVASLVELKTRCMQGGRKPRRERADEYPRRELDPERLDDVIDAVAEAFDATTDSRHDLSLPLAGALIRTFGRNAAKSILVPAWHRVMSDESRHGEIERTIEDTLEAIKAGRATGIPSLPQGVWPTILEAAGQAPIDEPDEAAHTEPFPIDALPDELARIVDTFAEHASVDPAAVALGTFAALASGIGSARRLQLITGWTENASIWGLQVDKSGRGKTPNFKRVTAPAIVEDDRLQERYRAELDAYKASNKKHKLKSGDEVISESERREPTMRRTVVMNATTEALMPILHDNPRGVLCAVDEASGWATGMNQYKGGRGDDRQNWLSLWAGTSVKVDRRGLDVPLSVKAPVVSFFGGIQPSVIGDLGLEREDGMLPRFLLVYPDPVKRRLTLRVKHDGTEAAESYARLYRIMREIDPSEHAMELDGGAIGVFEEYWNAVNDAAEAPATPAALREMLLKMPSHAARLSIVLAQIREPSCMTVTADDMARTVRLCRYFEGQARKVIAYRTRLSDKARLERYAFALLKRHGGVIRQTPAGFFGMFPEDIRGERPADLMRHLTRIAANNDGLEFDKGIRVYRDGEQMRLNVLRIVGFDSPPKVIHAGGKRLGEESRNGGGPPTNGHGVRHGDPDLYAALFGESKTYSELAAELGISGAEADSRAREWFGKGVEFINGVAKYRLAEVKSEVPA